MPCTLKNAAPRHFRGMPHHRRAFTLVEVIVIVTIIALLASVVGPKLYQQIGKSKVKIARQGVASIHNQVEVWLADNEYSMLPDDFELELLSEGPDATLSGKDLLDPWGYPYQLIDHEGPGGFAIMSFGEFSEEGGEDTAEDILSE